MNKRQFCLLFICGIIALQNILPVRYSKRIDSIAEVNDVWVSQTIHDAFNITHNANFSDFGFPGSGTAEDPYIIEDIQIVDENLCIAVFNTTAYFEIRSSMFQGENSGDALKLQNVTHAKIAGCSFLDCKNGITLYQVYDSSIESCDIGSCSRGIDAVDLEDCNITDNYIGLCFYGMRIFICESSEIASNIIENVFGNGIIIGYNGYDSSLRNNTINRIGEDSAGVGIWLMSVTGWRIESNTIANATIGIISMQSQFYDIVRNTISDTYNGMIFSYDRTTTVQHNDIHRTLIGVSIQACQSVLVSGMTFREIGISDLHVFVSTSCPISNNSMERGVLVEDEPMRRDVSYWKHEFENNSLPNGQLRYLVDRSDLQVDSEDIAQLVLVNCINVNISGAVLEDSVWGATLAYSERCAILESEITDNNIGGLYVQDSRHILIDRSIISENGQYSGLVSAGLMFRRSIACNITQNIIYRNEGDGIQLNNSDGCLVYGNSVVNNTGFGISLEGYNNQIYGNAIGWNEKGNAYCEGVENYWYSPEFLLGNYWSDYEGAGAYDISGPADSQDIYPQTLSEYRLTTPSTEEETDNPQNYPDIAFISLALTIGVALIALIVLRKKKVI